jgi:hypothetical protein
MKLCINAEIFELIAENPKVKRAGVYWNESSKCYKAVFDLEDETFEYRFRDNLQKLSEPINVEE